MDHRQDIYAALDRRMAHWADIVELAQLDPPADLLERLEVDATDYPSETAFELLQADLLQADILALEVLRSDSSGEIRRIEFLLTCGGPTVRLDVELSGGAVQTAFYFHSWGKAGDAEDARDLQRIETRPRHDQIIADVLALLGVEL